MHTMWVSYVINGSHTLISDQQQSSLLCTFSVSAESHRLWSLHHFSELQASRGAAVGQYAAAVMRNVPVMLSHFPGCLLISYVTESRPAPLISCWDSQQGMMGEVPTQCSLLHSRPFPFHYSSHSLSCNLSVFLLSVYSLLFALPTSKAYIL